jgi:hypothetical protein
VPERLGGVLYVNDAVIKLQYVFGLFHWWNNHGTAEVKLEKTLPR